MIKKESSQSKTSKSLTPRLANSSQVSTQSSNQNVCLGRTDFIRWARKLATQERYVALRVKLPKLTLAYRELTRNYSTYCLSEQSELKKVGVKKNAEDPYQAFIESIVFMSEDQYLDSIGFDYGCVQNPEKLYELLMAIRVLDYQQSKGKQQVQQFNSQFIIDKQYFDKAAWAKYVAYQIQTLYIQRIGSKWDPGILEQEKTQKKQFVQFWKNLREQQKLQYLRLGCETFKQLSEKLTYNNVELRPNEIQAQIGQILKSDKNALCNKIFKWKIKKNNPVICQYYEYLYKRWKMIDRGSKIRKKSNLRHKNRKSRRQKSIDAMSNQTNQTQIKQIKIQINTKSLASVIIQRDIQYCADQISELANSYFDRRVLAYERLKYILQTCGINIRLYGSCACGIAIQNSDLDVAVDQSILQNYEYMDTTSGKVNLALSGIESVLKTLPFVSGIKMISSAYIPIIKFTIDTEKQCPFFGMTSSYQNEKTAAYLNRKIQNGGEVQVDLTIQTKKDLIHLGLKSTQQIRTWLDKYPTLRPILIILKNQLTLKNLNETYTSGLNTYSLTVMLVACIQYLGLQNETNIGTVIERLLKLIGEEFDEKLYGIDLTLQKPGIIYRKKNENSSSSADLEIKDPLNNGKVMTKNCYRFTQIKFLLMSIYSKCIVKTQNRIQQICSSWNPKEERLNPQQLEEMVLDSFKGNAFQILLT